MNNNNNEKKEVTVLDVLSVIMREENEEKRKKEACYELTYDVRDFKTIELIAKDFENDPQKYESIYDEVDAIVKFYGVIAWVKLLEKENPGTFVLHYGKPSRTGQSCKSKLYYFNKGYNFDISKAYCEARFMVIDKIEGRYFDDYAKKDIESRLGFEIKNLVRIENI